MSNSLWPHGLKHARLPCPPLSPGVCSNFTFTELVMLFVYLLFIAAYNGRVEWLQRRPHGLQSWKYLLSACTHAKSLSRVRLFVTLWIAARQASLSITKSLQSCPIWCGPMDSARLLCPWDSPGKDTGVGCCALLQGIFLTQGSNPSLLRLNWKVGSLPPAPSGKPFTFQK